jgi:pimeloyl-ACP methyl ester carboxylesterase
MRLQIGDLHLEAAWYGPRPEKAPTLVFLHDGLGCAATWRELPADLAAATGCGALVYSRAGHGASDPGPAQRSLDFLSEEAALLPSVLAAAGVRESIWIGHSDGGTIALVGAANAARDGAVGPRALVTIAPHIDCEPQTQRAIAQMVREVDAAGPGQGGYLDRLIRHHGAGAERLFRSWSGVWLDPKFLRWSIEPRLSAVAIPLLVIQGTDDPHGSLHHLETIERRCPGPVSRLVVSGGHAPHRAHPAEVRSAILSFVQAQISDGAVGH